MSRRSCAGRDLPVGLQTYSESTLCRLVDSYTCICIIFCASVDCFKLCICICTYLCVRTSPHIYAAAHIHNPIIVVEMIPLPEFCDSFCIMFERQPFPLSLPKPCNHMQPPLNVSIWFYQIHMEVSVNGAIQTKWLAYNGQTHENEWFGGNPISGNHHIPYCASSMKRDDQHWLGLGSGQIDLAEPPFHAYRLVVHDNVVPNVEWLFAWVAISSEHTYKKYQEIIIDWRF